MKNLKDLLKFKSGKELDIKFPIKLEDSNGNLIYFEDSNGYWMKRELDSNGNKIYFEDSTGYIINDRPKEIKELSVEEIQEKLGFKIKIVENKNESLDSNIR